MRLTRGKTKDYKSWTKLISATAKHQNQQTQITIRDNGPGIPQDVLDKVFNPFFTTKAAGEGTGLGLSLSYDIITKSHDGELKVNTKPGEFTEFVIILRSTTNE